MTARITVNGREYSGPEEMPPEDREVYERMRGLLPAGGAPPGGFTVERSTVQHYTDPAAMPPEVRALYEKARAAAESGQAPEEQVSVTTITGGSRDEFKGLAGGSEPAAPGERRVVLFEGPLLVAAAVALGVLLLVLLARVLLGAAG